MTSPAPATSSAAYRQALTALHKQQRAQLQLLIQQIDASLAADWQRGPGAAAEFFQPLLDAYAKALADLRALNDDPAATLDLSWLTSQNAQLQSIEASVRASMINYGQQAAKTVEDAQVAMLARGESDAEALLQEALNPAWELGVNPAMLWDRPNPGAIAQWLGRAGNGHPLGDLFSNFDREAAAAARQALLGGLATGANPMTILTALQQAMGISRSRALTISRTELLGSYRAAAHETYRANSDVLNGWLWSAGGNNPCALCMGMDGTLHGLEESLDDHPCGKCAPLPVTKPWDDILGPLGIDTSDMAETSLGAEGNYTPMSERFDSFSPERQRAIIGTQTGYEAYLRGEVTLKDFIGVRPGENGFPSSYYQRSLKEMQIPTRQAQRLVEPSQEILEKYSLGTLRYSDFGQITPDALMPAWAKASDESRIVYQILRNGLPYDMTSHEQGLLITNLEQMLRGQLPTNVRAAAERQLQALGQTVERATIGQAARDAEVAARALADEGFAIRTPLSREEQSAALQTQRDAAQAKLDKLSERWRSLVLRQSEFDPVEDREEFAAFEERIVKIEQQQGVQIAKIDQFDQKIAAAGDRITQTSTATSARQEAIHELTSEERAALGLPPEINPATVARNQYGEPILTSLPAERFKTLAFNPYVQGAKKVEQILASYGEHQLAAALSEMPYAELKQAATELGLKSARSKAETISRIVSHMTEGRYNGRFAAFAQNLAIQEGDAAAQRSILTDVLAARIDRITADATAADIRDWVKEHLPGLKSVDLMSLDTQAARLIANATANLIPELPDVANSILRITAENTYLESLAYVPRDGLSLIINTEKWADLAGIVERTPQYFEQGWWVSQTPEQIIGHEIGHLLQLNYKISNDAWIEAMDRVAAVGGNPLVSTYAGNKVEESFAETFALLVYGEPTDAQLPIAREMANILHDRGIDYTVLREAVGASYLDVADIS